MASVPLSLYLHIPFCQSRCTYCDFNTYAGLLDLLPAYTEALAEEIRRVGKGLLASQGVGGHAPMEDTGLHSIYFGGGTPSLLSLGQLSSTLGAICDTFAVTDDCEVSLEANPGTVDQAYLQGLRQLGVNRLSLGVQSAHEDELRLLGRRHSWEEALDAVGSAREAGFDNLNLDLILGLPGQGLTTWQETLSHVLSVAPDHLSLYALSLEKGTPLAERVERGDVTAPHPDLAADMMEYARDLLDAEDFVHYEVSNWARRSVEDVMPDRIRLACRHNLQYWRNEPYIGIGAGAHSCLAGWRYSNILSPRTYIHRMQKLEGREFRFTPALHKRSRVSRATEMGETMMLGLRLTEEGVRKARFFERFGVELDEIYGPELDELEAAGLIERRPDRFRLTRRGWLLGNQVFRAFV